jgi:hypothetical protein
MELPVARNISGLEISDGTLIDNSMWQLSRFDQVARPARHVCVIIVVQGVGQRVLEHELTAPDTQETGSLATITNIDGQIP